MNFKVYLVLLYSHMFIIHHSNAFNITKILNQYPSFSTFNHYLTDTNLSTEINSHKPITILAVPNNAITRLSGKSHDVLENLLRVHVVLGYYDTVTLRNMTNRYCKMTTLLQNTGQAVGQQGFLKATVEKNGNVFIGPAIQDAPKGAMLVRSIACEPCNVSVLHISTAIVPVQQLVCPVLAPGSDSNSPIGPPSQIPKISPVPTPEPGPTHSPQISPEQASSPNVVPSRASSPNTVPPQDSSPNAVPPQDSGPKEIPPPSPNPPMTAPSESSADAPEISNESPPKHTDKPEVADAPPVPPTQHADKDKSGSTSSFRISLDFVITIVLSSTLVI